MLSLDAIADMAARHDTTVSHAFRRALARRGYRAPTRDARYDGLMWCFRNFDSPMDGLR